MPKKSTARVERITVGRLHNLGNYEHMRYEISVEVNGVSAAQVMHNIECILNALDPKPPVSDCDLRRATEALAKPVSDWPEWERENEAAYKHYVASHEAWKEGYKRARQALDEIGGTSVYTDAKDKWDKWDKWD